mgnify:FL=1|jgi:ABC-type multidrug transport system ATPase subunit|tara:strand:- start:13899 stop:14519 length:621 start_codon:yes stop_codon:yes gene_type:complete
MQYLLSVRQLEKSFNSVTIFNSINFNIRGNSIYKLRGPNGAGKTTIMRIISSQILDYGGEVFLEERNIKNIGISLYKDVHYLAPHPSLYDYLTLEENVIFFSKLNKLDNLDKRNSLFKKFGLEDYRFKKAYQLSDGTKKKVSIVISLLVNPRFLILDEPYTYLDDVSIGVLNNIIQHYPQDGGGVLLADNSTGSSSLDLSGLIDLK